MVVVIIWRVIFRGFSTFGDISLAWGGHLGWWFGEGRGILSSPRGFSLITTHSPHLYGASHPPTPLFLFSIYFFPSHDSPPYNSSATIQWGFSLPPCRDIWSHASPSPLFWWNVDYYIGRLRIDGQLFSGLCNGWYGKSIFTVRRCDFCWRDSKPFIIRAFAWTWRWFAICNYNNIIQLNNWTMWYIYMGQNEMKGVREVNVSGKVDDWWMIWWWIGCVYDKL